MQRSWGQRLEIAGQEPRGVGSAKREKQVRELGQTVKTGLKEEAGGMTRATKTGVSAIRGEAERAGLEKRRFKEILPMCTNT